MTSFLCFWTVGDLGGAVIAGDVRWAIGEVPLTHKSKTYNAINPEGFLGADSDNPVENSTPDLKWQVELETQVH